jgi:hypothetical protein
MMVVVRLNEEEVEPHLPVALSFDFYEEVFVWTWGHHGRAPCLVCKQFWAETLQAMLASCTFKFTTNAAFRSLAISQRSIVRYIRRIMISSIITDINSFFADWCSTLTLPLVGRFDSLEGVRFELSVDYEYEKHREPAFLNNPGWQQAAILQSFQQHRLKPDLTSVTFELWDSFTSPAPTVVDEAIRKELLNCQAGYVSRPGEIESEESRC